MNMITLLELFECIETHLHDKLFYRLEITENDENSCKILFLEEDVPSKIIRTTSNMYDEVYNSICDRFGESVWTIKVHSVCYGDFIYVIIGEKVCITFRYVFKSGREWLYRFCNN
ncbi:MAG: hypothetical protein IJ220_01925 [Clostridia bacterium]|nr:hypothetical protein [Clostridia bacterium]